MIKYISEEEVDLLSPRNIRKSRSFDKVNQSKSSMGQSPEDLHPSTEALKMLKKQND